MNALPFLLGERELLTRLPERCGEYSFTKIPINGPQHIEVAQPTFHARGTAVINPSRFARLLNIANGLSYGGGMGMPEWVMLDCALLPSCFAGWMTPASTLSSKIQMGLNQGLDATESARSVARAHVEHHVGVHSGPLDLDPNESEWVPTSEFCSIPRLIPDEVVGYSLYSLQRGLGVRAKALGLWVMSQLGIRRQVGVAQWHNLAAVRAHLRFGPLELIDSATPLHTKAGETMIYRLTLAQPEALLALALGEISTINPASPPSDAEWVDAGDVMRWVKLRHQLDDQRVTVVAARQAAHGAQFAIHLTP